MGQAFEKFNLEGKTAVVTGGGTGLGYYMTRGLMRSGAKVMIAARREEVLEAAAQKLRSESDAGEVVFHTLDLNDRANVEHFARRAIETLGGVDIFVGNAAQDGLEKLEAVTDDNVDFMMQVNLISNIQLVRAFVPGMREKRWGRIMFSSSTNATKATAHEGTSIYAATKGALNSYSRVAAAELGHDGITVNSLLLGMYFTDMVQGVYDMIEREHGGGAGQQFIEAFGSMMMSGRLGREDEVEGMMQYLASDAASYVTGTEFCIDGGLNSMLRPNPIPDNPVYPKPF